MLSKSIEYALRAAVYLASQSPHVRTTEQIAATTLVPKAYLSKILQCLVRGRILVSQRGVGGGLSLAKKPEELTILDVVNAVEPLERIPVCPLGIPTHGKRLCPLHTRLDSALASIEEAFGQTTLADVLSEPSASIPLCDVSQSPTLHQLISP